MGVSRRGGGGGGCGDIVIDVAVLTVTVERMTMMTEHRKELK